MKSIHLRNRYLLLLDAALLTASVVVAYCLRFDGWVWGEGQRTIALWFVAIAIPLKLLSFWGIGLYRRLWRYASIAEVERIVVAGLLAAGVALLVGAAVLPLTGLTAARVPFSVLLMDGFFSTAAIALPRLLLRMLSQRPARQRRRDDASVLIAGAGAAGGIIAKQLWENPQLGLNPVGFVDDDTAKHGHRLYNLPVLGSLDDIPELVARLGVGELIIAMPTAPGRVVRKVVRSASQIGIKTSTVPGLHDILSGRKKVTSLRQVEIQDLLRREPIETDLELVRTHAAQETVLVTGAGGSIGSELCRQLARLEPKSIVLLGHGENSIFDILQELEARFPAVAMVPVIADIRDRDRMRAAFERYRPFAVFHAAAHKHVPLMEANVAEAVSNNVLGTRNVVELAAEFGTHHLVLISTDKAVRPTNVMGATKRVAELIVQEVAELQHRNFVAVRFGNVLGSRGSVVPTFLRQIQAGGPVTVTHPEMRRYFMTIPEAVQLVLQAGALGRGGEVFVLDMGEPVKIVDLATDLIRLSGLDVGADIEVRFTGARPGEKLYEELFFSSESAVPTGHPKILRARNGMLPAGIAGLVDELVELSTRGATADELRQVLLRLVLDYNPSGSAMPIRNKSGRASGAGAAPQESGA